MKMELIENSPSLFVWRHKYTLDYLHEGVLGNCIYCNSILKNTTLWETQEKLSYGIRYEKICKNCGWNFGVLYCCGYGIGEEEVNIAGLFEFNINDPKIAIDELGTFLKKNFSNIYNISPIKFEQLIADVFKNFGYKVQLTQSSRDDGVDIYVFGKNDSEMAIIECKRYAKTNTVGVAIVDRLLGVALAKGAKHASLVTTSSFTKPAENHAFSPNLKRIGIKLDLYEAEDVFNLLNIYNKELPPFHQEIQFRWDE